MRLAIAAVGALAIATALAAQTPTTPAPQRQPTFKTGVNFVRVDVYPSLNGQIVGDLKQAEFEVLEDGIPQRVETFERVAIRAPGAEVDRAEPRSIAESDQAAADARNRLFVLFLDSYHTSVDATTVNTTAGADVQRRSRAQLQQTTADSRVGRALAAFLQQLIGPDDLIALTRPELSMDALAFMRRPSSFEELLRTGGEWQRRGVRDDLDAVERDYQVCYPSEPNVVASMIARRRERIVITALHNLVRHLEGLREERKAILVVSEGWGLFKPDPTMTAQPEGRAIGPPPIGIAGGQPVLGDPHDAAPHASCDRDRMMLADIDDEREFRDMLADANRSNASFYPIHPRGLEVSPMANNGGTLAEKLRAELSPLRDADARRTPYETLQTLADATDGVPILGSDLASNLRRISDDLSSYYLLGYTSTNAKLDGKFRKIAVRVKRPGVTVRARSGYNAPTEAEMSARAKPAAPRDREEETRGNALSSLGTERLDRPLRLAAGYGFDAASPEGQPRRPLLWVVGELDPAAARTMEWSGGGEATIVIAAAGGQTVATAHATTTASAPRFSVQVSDAQMKAGDYLVKVRLQGKSGKAADESGQLRVSLPDVSGSTSSMLGQPMLFRRGPFTGAGFQPTADLRFRKAERIQVDVPLAGVIESNAAQLLDRKGQPLPLPVTAAQREEGAQRFATAELALAPLAPGDYLIEVSVRRGEKTDKVLVAFRIVP
jgi:VWFA-related protein